MALYVLAYHLRLSGALERLSRARPDVEWRARPIGRRWLAESEEGTPLERGPGAFDPVLLVARSPAERRFLESLDRWDAVVLPPLRWKAGELTVRILASVRRPPAGWVRRYPDARLVALRAVAASDLPGEIATAPSWSRGLSPRQREVLSLAVREGYYDVPRRTDVARLAAVLGLGRSTVEEHLRLAESWVIRAVAPMTEGWGPEGGSLPGPEAMASFARFSADLDLYVWMALRGERIARVELRRTVSKGERTGTHPYLDRIVEHIASGRDDLLDLPVALGMSPFDRSVLEEVRRIPSGRTASYAEVARRVGHPRSARAVGNALARNPALVVVPCHRVLPSSGRVGNYSGAGGPLTKERLLRQEGAEFTEGG